jgi:drug/metabolite transporter (DMT)-like permease
MAYSLVVLAMPQVSNVSFVQAFRQMSLPLGVAAGIFILKEKCPPVRLAGVAAVVTGLIITALK